MNGKTVAILESRLGRQLGELIVKHGGRPIHAPALAEVPDIDPEFIKRLVVDLESHPAKIAVFQTGVGTAALFKTTDELGLTEALKALLARMIVVVRGPKPTGVLRARGVRIDLSAKEPFTTTEILQSLETVPLADGGVPVRPYGVANVKLEETLKARGAQLMEITTYRWALPGNTRPLLDLMGALERGEVDAVAVTNAAQVYNFFALAERSGRTRALRDSLNRTLVASIGPVSSEALKRFGVVAKLEASPPKLGPLMTALDAALKG